MDAMDPEYAPSTGTPGEFGDDSHPSTSHYASISLVCVCEVWWGRVFFAVHICPFHFFVNGI